MTRSTYFASVALAAVSMVSLGGCSTNGAGADVSSTAPVSEVSGDITVFAAASLEATFTELGKQFEAANPGTSVTFTFAGSSDLVTQLTQGAPGDVFASADTTNMTKAVEAKLVDGDPTDFASNTLTIVTAPGNPKGITSLADLADPDNLVVICAPQVPCGSATAKVETAARVDIPAVSEESAVTDVLGKVTSGEADAGLVYVTDASGAGDRVAAVPFPESSGAVNHYPIAVLADSPNVATATAFEDLVISDEGRKILSDAGFAAP